MEDDRVKTDAVEEAQAVGELVDLVEDGAANLDDGELGGVRRVGRRGKDAEVPLDLSLRADGVEQPSDGVLWAGV